MPLGTPKIAEVSPAVRTPSRPPAACAPPLQRARTRAALVNHAPCSTVRRSQSSAAGVLLLLAALAVLTADSML